MKKDPTSGRYQVLLHRRGQGLREEYHWGIPGGGLEQYERSALSADRELNSAIRRRAALRETIEEAGSGELTGFIGSEVEVDAIEGTPIRPKLFRNVLIPEGMKQMVSNSSVTIAVPSKFAVFLYVLDPSLDGPFISDWCPRAMMRYRGEIDESYNKHGTVHGYIWVDLEHLFAAPDHPVQGSSMGMCDFVRKIFIEPPSIDVIRRRIAELEQGMLSQSSYLGRPLGCGPAYSVKAFEFTNPVNGKLWRLFIGNASSVLELIENGKISDCSSNLSYKPYYQISHVINCSAAQEPHKFMNVREGIVYANVASEV